MKLSLRPSPPPEPRRYPQQFLALLGPRATGKTTYIAALLHWETAPGNPYFSISKVYGHAAQLQPEAAKIFCGGQVFVPHQDQDEVLNFGPTPVTNIFDIRKYGLELVIKTPPRQRDVVLDLFCEDYPGEVFAAMRLSKPDEKLNQAGNPGYMGEIFRSEVVGCLIFLDQWLNDPLPLALADPIATSWDQYYWQCLKGFIRQASIRKRASNMKLLVALSKCERGEAWPARLEPEEDVFRRRFPQTYELLTTQWPRANLRFHTLSTFGVLHPTQDPRPNRKTTPGKADSLRQSDFTTWKPYGVVSPLYWLSTGETIPPHI